MKTIGCSTFQCNCCQFDNLWETEIIFIFNNIDLNVTDTTLSVEFLRQAGRLMPKASKWRVFPPDNSALAEFNKQKNILKIYSILAALILKWEKNELKFYPFHEKKRFCGVAKLWWWKKLWGTLFPEMEKKASTVEHLTLLRHLICKLMEWGIFFIIKGGRF